MKQKALWVALCVVLTVVTAGCATVETTTATRDDIAADCPLCMTVLEDMERSEGARYSDSKLIELTSGSDHYTFRMALLAACPSCYDTLLAHEREDGRLWTAAELQSRLESIRRE